VTLICQEKKSSRQVLRPYRRHPENSRSLAQGFDGPVKVFVDGVGFIKSAQIVPMIEGESKLCPNCAQVSGAGELVTMASAHKSNKIAALRRLILVAGAGFEPATFGL
jgi:hypothetical protein